MQYVADALIQRESLGKCLDIKKMIYLDFFFSDLFYLKKLKLNTRVTNLTSENKETQSIITLHTGQMAKGMHDSIICCTFSSLVSIYQQSANKSSEDWALKMIGF